MTRAELEARSVERAEAAVKLHREGMSCTAIASRLGVSRPAVVRWLRAAGCDTTANRGWEPGAPP